MNKAIFLTAFLILLPLHSEAAVFHVRMDGGSPSQCNGQTEAPYSASLKSRSCAWQHPFDALGVLNGAQPRIGGGDTLIIHRGSYRMGFDRAIEGCSTSFTYDCRPRPIPSGTPKQHTKILGETYNSGCNNPPELWGTENIYAVLSLQDSSNIDIACLEITDHASCRAGGPPENQCKRGEYPVGDYGQSGILAQNSSNVTLTDVNIHGMAYYGLYTGKLADWTLTRVKVNGQGQAGWHGEAIPGRSSNSGNIVIRNSEFMWNGCAENYPAKTSPVKGSCCSQSQHCYNDGIGMADSGGNYLIEDSNVSFNAEDGIDLLHVTLNQPTTIIVRRTRAEGNAGNALKTGATNVILENNILISGCRYLEEAGFAAKSFVGGDNSCRAGGEPLAMNIDRGSHHKIFNNTIIQTVAEKNSSIVDKESALECDGTESIDFINNIWLGGNYLQYNDVQGCKGFSETKMRSAYSNVFGVRSGCPVGKGNICTDPKLAGFRGIKYMPRANAALTASSPGRDKGLSSLKFSDSTNDFTNSPRDKNFDMGAIEFK